MKPIVRLLSTAAAVATTTGVIAVSVVSSADARPVTPSAAHKAITLFATPTAGAPIDTAPSGPSVGDEYFEHGTVTDATGHQVGSATLAITLVADTAHTDSEQQTVTLYLGDSSLDLSGGHHSVGHFAVPVVGGTGQYRGVAGAARFSPASQHREKIVLSLG